jgi:hypothetical protein
MFFTSGDVYYALTTAGMTCVFAGLGLCLAEVPRPARMAGGWGLMLAGLATIAAPALGVVGRLL